MSQNDVVQKLGIVRITPSFLDVGQVWFTQNKNLIHKQAKNPFSWWSNNYKQIEKDERMSTSVLLRHLSDWGYQKTTIVQSPGSYATRGGIVDVFPINTQNAYRIEFTGNAIETILKLPDTTTDPQQPLKKTIYTTPERPSHDQKEKQQYQDLLHSLQPNSYVVHINHGIGIFRGIENKYIVIEYALGDMLRVPVETIGRITPYVGFTNPTLTRLGGNLWEKTKQKVKENLLEVARELLAIYATRELSSKTPYTPVNRFLKAVELSFPFVETSDQQKAMNDVYKDLTSNKPMDRVIVADVGFGKTEIALRACVMAVENGHQVALIAPTTILAHQHYKTFTHRFLQSDCPIRVAQLTRIQRRSEQRKTLQNLREKKIDVVIGTHRLLQKDIEFARLGLLVIDEEQRFGVKQKELLKSYRADIDILSLSATPIPRTLSAALSDIRDLSVISTPPKGRIPILTTIAPLQQTTIQNALQQELERNGQVYFLHNRILSLGPTVQEIQKLVPNARIQFIHSKMDEDKIIKTIDAFAEHEIDVLVSTTIMENGLDMANANTLIVDNATHLGLAQLHQIRGRIGRGQKQAYAYLLYPQKKLTDKAKKRLDALKQYQALGDGYHIALRDLEIRGAGNLLGKAQSGNVVRVGFNLYCQLLNEAVEQMKKENTE